VLSFLSRCCYRVLPCAHAPGGVMKQPGKKERSGNGASRRVPACSLVLLLLPQCRHRVVPYRGPGDAAQPAVAQAG
jgi:hypothetical protein